MCPPSSTGDRKNQQIVLQKAEDEEKASTERQKRLRQHSWSTIGLCGSAFSMFYLIMNVFPYSGFMALWLLNSAVSSDGQAQELRHPLYVAANIGPYAGILASSFRLGRIPTAIFWGRCADVYGRKFALLVGIVAMIVGNLWFGMAPTFATAVAVRFGTGLLNGTMVVVRTAISEIAHGDPQLEAKGVAMMSSMSGYGMLIGPALGGLLSDPIRQYPSYFGSSSKLQSLGEAMLERHPFVLPNIIGSVVALASLIIVVTCVEETLPEDQLRDWRLVPMDICSWIASKNNTIFRRRKNHQRRREGYHQDEVGQSSSSDNENLSPAESLPPIIPEARIADATGIDERTPLVPSPKNARAKTKGDEKTGILVAFWDDRTNVRYYFYSMWSYAFTSLATQEAFPLFAMTSTAKGGLGLDETGIGLVQTIAGCLFVAGQYPSFLMATKTFGSNQALRFAALGRCLLLLLVPLGVFFSSNTSTSSMEGNSDCHSIADDNLRASSCNNQHPTKNWYQLGYLGFVIGVLSILGSIYMGCATIGVNACLRDPGQRASMNGLQSMVASMGRGLGPIVSGYLVASSMTSDAIPVSIAAWLVYGVLVGMEAITYKSTRLISDRKVDDKTAGYSSEDEDEKNTPEEMETQT